MIRRVSSADSIRLAERQGLIASVVYQSRGKLLIVCGGADFPDIFDAIPPNLEPFVVFEEVCGNTLRRRLQESGIQWLENTTDLFIEGYLGNFRVAVKDPAGNVRTPLLYADLVLDLLPTPMISHSVPPIGYFSIQSGDEVRQKIGELDAWTGEFEKPKFFSFDAGLCAHESSSIAGCSACIASCGARAIASASGKIEINPFLCQGCGDCADVCPSGAIRYHYPPPEFTLNRLREEIHRLQADARNPCVVVFHDAATGARRCDDLGTLRDADILAFELESTGAVGAEIWLSALAYGASGVAILVDESLTPESKSSLETQIRYCNEILEGAGLLSCVMLTGRLDALQALIDLLPRQPRPTPARFAGLRDKRSTIRLALDTLTRGLEPLPECAVLSDGAPFGAVVVDPDRCTLCMACVSVCPESALMDAADEPRLTFIEANCVQCGICRKACPESAIALSPRYLFDGGTARRARLLHQDSPFCCIQCGKAFATRKVIERIEEKLLSHSMFQGGNLERLRLCDECRVKSFFAGTDAGRF